MGIFMDFDGIEGAATQQDHKRWIDVLSLSWGTGRGIPSVAGTAVNREFAEPSLSDVEIVKHFDAESPELFTEACSGNVGKTVKIDITTTGSPSVVYCTYTLTKALISSYSVSSSGDRPTESVSISFTKMEFKFTPYDDKNTAGTPTTVSYDLATTKKSTISAQAISELAVVHDQSSADISPVLERAGDDIIFSYDRTTKTGTFQSGAIELTSRLGSADNDFMIGTDKSDILNGLGGNDVSRGGAGNDVINGGDGVDTAVFSGTIAQHAIASGGIRAALVLPNGSYGDEALNVIDASQFNVGAGELRTVTDLIPNRDGVDILSQVERLKFIDGIVAFDTGKGESAGEAFRLYKAAFGSTPDLKGLGFWVKHLDQGTSLSEVASAFISSPQFAHIYGPNVSDTIFVTLLYKNALNREPDAEGMAYWLDALSHGVSRALALTAFSESSESVSIASSLVANGINYQEWIV